MKQTARSERNPADYGYPTPDVEALSTKAIEVTQRLTEHYGEVPFSSKDPMSMLVDIILSHRTRDEQTAAAYDNLLRCFGSGEAVRDAPTSEVQATIDNVNFPEVKAPRLQTIMRQITQERGNLDLDFLCDLPVEESAAWLNRFEGVGPKTTACVLLFSCQQPLLPVDVHVHRALLRRCGARRGSKNHGRSSRTCVPAGVEILAEHPLPIRPGLCSKQCRLREQYENCDPKQRCFGGLVPKSTMLQGVNTLIPQIRRSLPGAQAAVDPASGIAC